MAAPLYFQNEISHLLGLKKRILCDGWKVLEPDEKRASRVRENVFEQVCTMKAIPFDDSDASTFKIMTCRNLRGDDFSITLWASIAPRALVPICRYDIHDSPHANPAWFPPELIESGQYHRHVYNERAIREGDVTSWCACGEPYDVHTSGGPLAQLDRLKRLIIDDLNLHFDDRDGRRLFQES